MSFLKKCYHNKVIPKTFDIKHNIDSRYSTSAKNKIQSSFKNVSLNNIKIAIEENTVMLIDWETKFLTNKRDLLVHLLTEDQDLVNKELEIRSQKFFICERDRSI